MIDVNNLKGRWEGSFTYGDGYPQEYFSIREPFMFEISVDGNILKGICVDNYTKKYFHQPATIEGSFIDGVISLIKKYPYFLGTDEDENIFVDVTMPAHEIHYVGQMRKNLFSKEYFFEGAWDMSGSFLDDNGSANYYTMEGNWEMSRSR